MPSRPKYSHAEQLTFAARLFRLHEAAAPHMGLVGAAVLILSGSVLYWLAFGSPRSSGNPAELLEFDQSLSSDANSPAETAPEEPPAANADRVAAPLDWHAAPRVADATAVPSAPEAPVDAQPQATVEAEESAADSPSLSPAAAVKPSFDKSASAAIEEPITPTPHTEFYPTTPYPAFSFTTTTPDASSGESVAERISPASDESNATR